MYKCVFKEKRGTDSIFAMQLTADSSEVAEVLVSRDDMERANLNTLADRNGFLRSLRVKWQKGFAPASLFAGLEDIDSLPPGAQAMADAIGLPEPDALIYFQTTHLSSAWDFYNWVRTTADNSDLGIPDPNA